MRYLLDELHAYEHDYSGALCRVSHKANPSLAGERALCAPASRKELASFQKLIRADVKDVRDALVNLDTKVSRIEANLDTKVGRIEDMLRGLTEAITGACVGPIPAPSSSGLPPAYSTLSGMPLWFFFCVVADCYALTTEHTAHPQHLTTQLPAPPASNHIGPRHFSFSCTPTQAFVTQSSPAASNASSPLDFVSPKLTIPDVPPRNGPKMPRNEGWKEVVRHWQEGAPELNLPIPLKDWPHDYLHGPNRHLQSKYNQRRIIATEFIDR